jgi:phage terminase large subunit-like protein
VTQSRADRLAEAGRLAELFQALDDDEAAALAFDWEFWRRPEQAIPEGDWDVWSIRAGRGFGKTRTGAETVRELARRSTTGLLGAIAPTSGDARDVLVEGESGLLAISPPWDRPKYEPSKRRVTWNNGARMTLFSGEEPDRLRGPQHEVVWIDEPASMPLGEETVDNARLGLRLGQAPRLIMTGTPRRRPWMRRLEEEAGSVVTTGSTYENLRNLAPTFIKVILGRYEGTRLGRQELHAEYLDDVEGALWTLDTIESNRFVEWNADSPDLALRSALMKNGCEQPPPDRRRWRTIVAVDPPAETAECGISVGSAPIKGRAGIDHAVILADESASGRPEEWGQAVVAAARRWGAEAVYVEANQGGDMCRATIHAVDPSVVVKKITASVSKHARAEPVAALDERGWIHHVGVFPTLEDQMTSWVSGESRSPDRLDARVHLVRELLQDRGSGRGKIGSITDVTF